MIARSAIYGTLPALLTLAAGWNIWRWLWGRWFSTGEENLYGAIHLFLVAACLVVSLRGERRENTTNQPALAVAALFLLAAAAFYGRIPTLLVSVLYSSAFYWSFRASPTLHEKMRLFAIWPLLTLSLPIGPSLQFVFGYPLRALAAWLAAAVLPDGVRAVGCGIGDGRIEVFVDAPCAGAGMLLSALILAAGASLAYGLGWARCILMLVVGTATALFANAARAVILYLGNAGMLALPLHRYEEATGLICFVVCAAFLTAAAGFLAKTRHRENKKKARPEKRLQRKTVAAYGAGCIIFLLATFSAPQRQSARVIPDGVVWPEQWNGRPLAACAPSSETEIFLRSFPGVCREFAVLPPESKQPDDGEPTPDRIVMRLVLRPTRLLHPAEDCFRGSGYSITFLPARTDRHDRLWSGFVGERNGRRQIVRQSVIALEDLNLHVADEGGESKSWPDVSSWYWDAARPGSGVSPAALAITTISHAEK